MSLIRLASVLAGVAITAGSEPAVAEPVGAAFRSAWPEGVERVWAGRDFWTNPLQDWRVADGRLECVAGGPDRNVHLLTHQLGATPGTFETRVHLEPLDGAAAPPAAGWAGFRVGIRGQFDDYRDSVRRGRGLDAGVTAGGRLFIGARPSPRAEEGAAAVPLGRFELRLSARPEGEAYTLVLTAHDATGGQLAAVRREGVPAEALAGNLALVCHGPRPGRRGRRTDKTGAQVRFAFRHWTVGGSKVEHHPDHAFGPILWAQHTLSRGVLKLTAQMPPLGEKDAKTVRLEVDRGERWTEVARAGIHPLARTATFRVADWDASRAWPYRVVYGLREAHGKTRDYVYMGTIRRDPAAKGQIVLAAFTGNADYGFPNADVVRHVAAHDPDVLFFSGDNIYENVGGYGATRRPLETACLDYLRKWYFYGWAFGPLVKDRPTVSIPDDHDVYQGNLWGHGGCPTDRDSGGGYVMPPDWVNVVQRTQTSHLPDPYDPAPVEQGITVYYTSMLYGRIDFAVLEDRKFKTGPAGVCPPTGGRPDHVRDPDFDPKTADVPGAKLLGDRQLGFLRDWAADWRGADFKCALSQTVFAGVATHHGRNLTRLVADYDSNGWPQTGRRKALAELRKAFAFHVAGDQHLATLVHHGIDTWGDAAWSFAVPSVSNFYLRAWDPPEKPGGNHVPGMPDYTGRFRDGLGNYVTVWAATNPGGSMGVEPAALHDKKPGYGIVRFDKARRTITMECWPRFADPRDPKGVQYEGWPKTIRQAENYGRPAAAWLPTVRVEGIDDPVVQVLDEASGEIVYTIRIEGRSWRPKVFRAGTYTVGVGDPDAGPMQTFKGIASVAEDSDETLDVRF